MTPEQIKEIALRVARRFFSPSEDGTKIYTNDPYSAGEITDDLYAYTSAILEEVQKASEPVAWLFQHDETGRTVCVDAWQVENGFEENNPRLQKIHPLYLHPPVAPDGMVLVPKEPTKEMIDAGLCGCMDNDVTVCVYQAMLAAAPMVCRTCGGEIAESNGSRYCKNGCQIYTAAPVGSQYMTPRSIEYVKQVQP